jgi:phosphoribosylpyrophosphate synthetase
VYYFSDPHGDAMSIDPKSGKSETRSLNDRLMHDVFTAGALQENGARTVNLVLMTMPYARQDKATPGQRQAASLDRLAKWMSDITGQNGYIINMDLHNPASKSSFQGTNFINLYSDWFVKKVIESLRKAGQDIEPVLLPADQ